MLSGSGPWCTIFLKCKYIVKNWIWLTSIILVIFLFCVRNNEKKSIVTFPFIDFPYTYLKWIPKTPQKRISWKLFLSKGRLKACDNLPCTYYPGQFHLETMVSFFFLSHLLNIFSTASNHNFLCPSFQSMQSLSIYLFCNLIIIFSFPYDQTASLFKYAILTAISFYFLLSCPILTSVQEDVHLFLLILTNINSSLLPAFELKRCTAWCTCSNFSPLMVNLQSFTLFS